MDRTKPFGNRLKRSLEVCPESEKCVLAEMFEKRGKQIVECAKHVREIAAHLANTFYENESGFKLAGAYFFAEIGVYTRCGSTLCEHILDRHGFNLDARLLERLEVRKGDFPARKEYPKDTTETEPSIAAAIRVGGRLRQILLDTSTYFNRLTDLTSDDAPSFKRHGIYIFAEKGFLEDSGIADKIQPECFFMGDSEYLERRFKINPAVEAEEIL